MNITLHHSRTGNGPPLLLLHGNGEDASYFTHQIRHFSHQYTVIAIDTRGHGRSPRGTAPFSIRQFAADLYDFMTAQGIAKAHILGFSDGGNIALYFALAHPEMVDKLILNGANLYPAGVKASAQLPVEIGYRIASIFAKRDPDSEKKAEMLGLMVKEPRINPKELQRLTMPTLVIAGTNDMIKTSHTRLIARSLPKSELAFVRGDHFIAANNPAEFNRCVDEFLNNPASPRQPAYSKTEL